MLSTLEQTIKSCTKCRLHCTRTNAVPGKGSDKADIMIIGEAPGKKEDKLGEPFVGASGKFLNELLSSINLKREDIYITNVVKCRPPENRDPKKDEIATCNPYLKKQVELIKPKIILLLGRHAMYRFLPKDLKISEVHGVPHVAEGIATETQLYLPLYHPAVALYNGSYRQVLLDDFAKIPEILKNAL